MMLTRSDWIKGKFQVTEQGAPWKTNSNELHKKFFMKIVNKIKECKSYII